MLFFGNYAIGYFSLSKSIGKVEVSRKLSTITILHWYGEQSYKNSI